MSGVSQYWGNWNIFKHSHRGTYKINHHLCCNDKCLICLLTCKVCAKQYTGYTVDKFRLQWSNYKDSDRTFLRGEEIKQKFLHEHFLKDDHHGFEKDVSICLIDKTQSSDPHKREYILLDENT